MTTQAKIAKLREARALIADAGHWTTGVCARDSDGDETDPRGDDAASWCVFGATERIMPRGAFALDNELRNTLSDSGYAYDVDAYNDSHTHTEVLDLFDRTVARLEREAVRV